MNGQFGTATGDPWTTAQRKGKNSNRNRGRNPKKAAKSNQFQPGFGGVKQGKPNAAPPTKNVAPKMNTWDVNAQRSTWDDNVQNITWDNNGNVNPSSWDHNVNPSFWDHNVNPSSWDHNVNVNQFSTWDDNPAPFNSQPIAAGAIAPTNPAWGLDDEVPPPDVNLPETPKDQEEWVVRDPNGPWELTELIVNTYCNAVEDWENTKAKTKKDYQILWRQNRTLDWVLTGTEEENVPTLREKGTRRPWKPFSAPRPTYEG